MKNRLAAMLCLLLALFTGCEGLESQNNEVRQPECYASIYEAFSRGSSFYAVEFTANAVIFSLREEGELEVPRSQMEIDDCREKKPAVVATAIGGKQWLVGGEPTGIAYDPKVPDRAAIPLYSYVDKNWFAVLLNNGNRLSIPRRYRAIPSVRLSTAGRAPIENTEDYVNGTIRVEDRDGVFSEMDGFEAEMKIRGRGNSTWYMPKKPYKIKFDSKESMFDMPKDKEWCLLANYCDKTLVRNMTAMEISRRLGFSWTPRMIPVEVYLNERYQGVYTFAEHRKVSKQRININLDKGDMMFEIEEQQDEPVSWWTEHGCPLMFSEPSEPTAEQVSFAKQLFKDLEDALWAKKFEKVYEMIDLKSFVDNFIIQELTKNCDGNLRKSSFLTLETGGKLEFYNVWDFDISLGNCDYYGNPPGNGPEGWWVKDHGATGRYHGWYYRLFMDPDFVQAVQKRWDEVYADMVTIPDYIDDLVAQMGDAPERNFATWKILGTYVWPNYKVFSTYVEEVAWLKEFYSQRLAWLNREIPKLR